MKPEDARADRPCKIGDLRAPVDFVLWGDSHAEALLPAIEQAAIARHRAGLFMSKAACPPLLGVERIDIANETCRAFNDKVAGLIARRHIREVILASRWSKHALGTDYGDSIQPTAFLVDQQSKSQSESEHKAVFLRALSRTMTLLSLAGARIVIVGPVPEVKGYVPESLAMARMFGTARDVRSTLAEFRQRQQFVLDAFRPLSQEYGLTIVFPHRVLCASGTCEIEKAGRALYRDSSHLTVFGAEQLTAQMKSVL